MATGIKQLHSTPGNPTTPSLGTGTGTQGTARMIRPSNVNYDLEELSAALHYNDEWLGRAKVAIEVLDQSNAHTAYARVIFFDKERAALCFHLAADIFRCAQLTRVVHRALGASFERVVPPALLIDVGPIAHPDAALAGSPTVLADLTASVSMLANSTTEASWRQAAVCAYVVAFRLARKLITAICPPTPNVLDSPLDTAIWQLRMHRSPEARALAEALASMQVTYSTAAFDFDAPFPQDQALLQSEAMKAFQADLDAFQATAA